MINRIGAVVVLFHPNEADYNNMLTYGDLVKDIIVIDNSEQRAEYNKRQVDMLQSKNVNKKFYYHSMGGNKGLCEAFNYGLKKAEELGCDWCFTMDSDSSFQNNIADVFCKIEKQLSNNQVAAFVPQHDHDRIVVKKNDDIKAVSWAMTSGTLFDVKKVLQIGGFDPWFFVDGLDVELGCRLRKMGYKIIRCNAAILNHFPAHTATKKIFNKTFKYGVAEPIRYYYQARADMKIVLTHFSVYAFFDLFMRLGKIVLLFERKNQYLKAWATGIYDAVRDIGGGGYKEAKDFETKA